MSGPVFVIIPFFQRQSGILRKALDSIAAQRDVSDVRVIVIDDSSPVSPRADIDESKLPSGAVEVVRQANTGPGIARSHGLDRVPADAGFVAFLDSDDEWLPGHLRNALDALGDDLDVYFSNYLEIDSARGAFEIHGRIRPEQHQPVRAGSNCYRFGHSMIDQIITGNVIETSTVVYRWARMRTLRFDPTFRNAFEDHDFWVRAQEAGCTFAFSTDVEVEYGRGVNIWRSSFDPGSERVLPKLVDQRRYLLGMLRKHARTPALRSQLRQQLTWVRETAAEHLLHRLRRRQGISASAFGDYLRLDPAFPLLFFPLVLKIVRARNAKRAAVSG